MFTTATAGGPLYCKSVTSADYSDVQRTRSVLSDIINSVNDFIRLTFDGEEQSGGRLHGSAAGSEFYTAKW